MTTRQLHRIKTISDYHRFRNLPKPEHPLISLIDYSTIKHSTDNNPVSWVFDFYSISLKRDINAKMKYGQQAYDFDEGTMFFIAPGQVFSIEVDPILHRIIQGGFYSSTPIFYGIRRWPKLSSSTNTSITRYMKLFICPRKKRS